MARLPFPRGGIRTRLPLTIYRRSSADEFSPTEIPGLALWLDASDGATLFQNSDGTTPATASSDPVGYWADKSGNGINLVQPTSTARPTRVSSYVNGRAALTFDGTDFLSVANSVALGNNTVIMVVREDASSNYAGLISYYPATGNDNGNADGWVADLQLTDNVITLSSGIYASQWAGAFALPLSVLTLRRQTDVGNRQIIRANGVTNAVNANASTGTAAGILIGGRFQSGAIDTLYRAKITLCEVLRWDRALTPAEYARVETALARKWGIALAPQVSNLDAQDWINRVYANGGTVSTATAASVNTLCDSLESASLRDRFYRLNLFCGSNLNSALVPLYRGPSLGGTQYGGTTDTNNAFGGVGIDYAETGASGGLTGNGSTKYLNTGLTSLSLPDPAVGHLSAWGRSQSFGRSGWVSSFGASYANGAYLEFNGSAGSLITGWGREQSISSSLGTGKHFLINRSTSTSQIAYANGSSIGDTAVATTMLGNSANFAIFARNVNGSIEAFTDARLNCYSIGASLSPTDVLAYYSALNTFFTALGRA
jgi:hypothetical protein